MYDSFLFIFFLVEYNKIKKEGKIYEKYLETL